MGLAPHLGRETELKALGKTWTLARWTRDVWEEFLVWARTQLPDPIEVALRHVDQLPPAIAEKLVAEALKQATGYLSIGSPRVTELLNSPEGITRLIWLLLRKHHPEASEDTALAIVFEVGAESLQAKIDQAAGVQSAPAGNGPGPAVAQPGLSSPSTGAKSTGSLSLSDISGPGNSAS